MQPLPARTVRGPLAVVVLGVGEVGRACMHSDTDCLVIAPKHAAPRKTTLAQAVEPGIALDYDVAAGGLHIVDVACIRTRKLRHLEAPEPFTAGAELLQPVAIRRLAFR